MVVRLQIRKVHMGRRLRRPIDLEMARKVTVLYLVNPGRKEVLIVPMSVKNQISMIIHGDDAIIRMTIGLSPWYSMQDKGLRAIQRFISDVE